MYEALIFALGQIFLDELLGISDAPLFGVEGDEGLFAEGTDRDVCGHFVGRRVLLLCGKVGILLIALPVSFRGVGADAEVDPILLLDLVLGITIEAIELGEEVLDLRFVLDSGH